MNSEKVLISKAATFYLFLVSAILFTGLNHGEVLSSNSHSSLEEISDRKYLPKLLELIQKAERSIEVSLYQALLVGDDPTHPVSQIFKALAEAQKRGARVRVMFNRYLDYSAGDTVPLARSLAATEYLKAKGIEVIFAHPSRRLHDKVIVIDERWVIEGSMNWTKTALQSNWESVTLIESPEYAAQKLTRLRAIPASPEKAVDSLGEEGEMIEIPALLMTEKKYFPDLLRRKDERIFEFYLWFLTRHLQLSARRHSERSEESSESEGRLREGSHEILRAFGPQDDVRSISLSDETLFRAFRLDPAKSHEDKRREALRLLKKLRKRGYLDFSVKAPGAPAEVKPKSIAQRPSFTIPFSYFEYGYPNHLSFAGEFAYLLSRLEMTQSPSAPWWWRSQEYLTRVYHLHHTTLASGMLELMRENLIEIVRDDAPEGRPHSERLVNRYRVNRLVSPAVREEQEKRLIQRFGRENFDRAQRFADIIDEPNNPLVIAAILKWMTEYPSQNLEAAFSQVSRYERNNPRRSLYYLYGILEAKSPPKGAV